MSRHQSVRNIPKETGRAVARGGAVQCPAAGAEDGQRGFGPRDGDIAEAPVLLHFFRIEQALHAGKNPVLEAGKEHAGKFQALGRVHGHQHDRVGAGVVVVHIGHQGILLEEARQVGKIRAAVLFVIEDGRSQFMQVVHPGGTLVPGGMPHIQIAGHLQHGLIEQMDGDVGIGVHLPQAVHHLDKRGDFGG